MKIPSSNLGRTCCVHNLFLTFKTIFVHNMFSPCSAKRRASDKDLPVQLFVKFLSEAEKSAKIEFSTKRKVQLRKSHNLLDNMTYLDFSRYSLEAWIPNSLRFKFKSHHSDEESYDAFKEYLSIINVPCIKIFSSNNYLSILNESSL